MCAGALYIYILLFSSTGALILFLYGYTLKLYDLRELIFSFIKTHDFIVHSKINFFKLYGLKICSY